MGPSGLDTGVGGREDGCCAAQLQGPVHTSVSPESSPTLYLLLPKAAASAPTEARLLTGSSGQNSASPGKR